MLVHASHLKGPRLHPTSSRNKAARASSPQAKAGAAATRNAQISALGKELDQMPLVPSNARILGPPPHVSTWFSPVLYL